jgi:hypothetical protein
MRGRVLAAVVAVAIGVMTPALVEANRSVAPSVSSARPAPTAAPAAVAPGKKTAKHVARNVKLTVSTKTKRPVAGARVTFTVKVTANRKPVARAAVRLALKSRPGKDARLLKPAGKTNARGVFTDVLRLSRKPGSYLVVVTSGGHKASWHVVSKAFKRAAQLAANPILAWIALATVGLVVLGVFVNLEVLRRVTWALTLGRLRRRRAARGP